MKRTHIFDIYTSEEPHSHLLDKLSIQHIFSQGTGGNKRSCRRCIGHSDRKVNLDRVRKELAARSGHLYHGIDDDIVNVRCNSIGN